MFCRFCGRALRADAAFCNQCGGAVNPPPEALPKVKYDIWCVPQICQSCGRPVQQEMKFCGGCGTPFQPKPVKRIPHCVGCDTPLMASARFCNNCGIPYNESASGFVEIPQEATCPQCGAELAEGNDFCGQCGIRLPEEQTLTVKKMTPCCPNCKAPLDCIGDFCPNCGKLWHPHQELWVPAVPKLVDEKLSCPTCGAGGMRPNVKNCLSCGAEFQSQPWVCGHCGIENYYHTKACFSCGSMSGW